MFVCHMCCQACLRQGNQSCLAAGPLRRRRLPAGGSQAPMEGCPPHTACITREKGQTNYKFCFKCNFHFENFFFFLCAFLLYSKGHRRNTGKRGMAHNKESKQGFNDSVLLVS